MSSAVLRALEKDFETAREAGDIDRMLDLVPPLTSAARSAASETFNDVFARHKGPASPPALRNAFIAISAEILALRRECSCAVAISRTRITALERRIGAFRYTGVWRSDAAYEPGNFTTYDGSLWHCNAQTQQRPGKGADWTLAVKCGRDGKDAR